MPFCAFTLALVSPSLWMVHQRITVFCYKMTQLMLYCNVQGLLYTWPCCFSFLPALDNPSLLSHVPVTVQVLDVNDNPPEVAADEEVIVCESSRPGQVSLRINVLLSSHCRRKVMKAVHAPGLGSQLFQGSVLSDCFPSFGLIFQSWVVRLRGHCWKLFNHHSKWVL